MKGKKWLIIADGLPLKTEKTRRLAINRSVIALDAALITCLDYGITPDLVLGDFDSLDRSYIKNIKNQHDIVFLHRPCQNSTDLEKALDYLLENKEDNISICHATGQRMDHTLYNLGLLKGFHNAFSELKIITETENIYFIRNQSLTLMGRKKLAVALMSFPHAVINSKGLKYDMKNHELELGLSESACNSLEQNNAQIDVDGDALLIIDDSIFLEAHLK